MKKFTSLIMALVLSLALCVPAFAAELDNETKREYYAEYVNIAAEVSAETKRDISVIPMDEFSEEDWQTPEEFRDFITKVAHWNLYCTALPDAQAYSSTSATKTTSLTVRGVTYTLSISGRFETGLNSDTKRQHFCGYSDITSSLVSGTGKWVQTGYVVKSLDAARTYAVHVSGEVTIGGAKFENLVAYTEFYCSATGVVD